MKWTRWASLLVLLVIGLAAGLARGDAGVFEGNGQNLRQITSKTIHLASIDVKIMPGQRPAPGQLDLVGYDCSFVLQNLSNKTEQVQVGFPVDSPMVQSSDAMEKGRRLVKEYGFTARDETISYPVDFVLQKKKDAGEQATFTWKMTFGAKETRKLRVAYHIPVSVGMVETCKPHDLEKALREAPWTLFMAIAYMERIGYITETGSSWAGNVEKARFAVVTGPFEKYVTERGFMENDPSESAADHKQVEEKFPIHDSWWFRQTDTPGVKEDKDGIFWEYRDYKPKDPIEVAYYFTQLPRTAKEVDKFVDVLVKLLDAKERKDPAAAMASVREILLATWGKPPTDKVALQFASRQYWYQPKKDFAVEKLTKEQQAVLAAFDRKVAALKKG